MTALTPLPHPLAGTRLDPVNPAPAAILDERWNIFLRVAEAGSLSQAATALDMPASMVSRAVAHLEKQCAECLFQRTGRGVLLTEFGAQLLPAVARLAADADADALADDIRSAGGRPVGEVLVGLLPSAVRRFTGPLCAAVREHMPGVRLHLVEGASALLEEQLREGRLDMAMVPREDAMAVGDDRLVARMALHLLGRAGDPVVASAEIPLAALSNLPLVVPARPHRLRARLDRFVVLAMSPRRPYTRAPREVRHLICELAAKVEGY